ncbi:MAG: glucosaminidase domain-containing protein [Pseudomonadota bacterium]
MADPLTSSPISYFDVGQLRNQTGNGNDLEAVAAQFESLFVSQMLKAMREATRALASEPLFGGSELTLRQDMLDQQWAIHLSESGGLGLRDLILGQLQGRSTPLREPADGVVRLKAAAVGSRSISTQAALTSPVSLQVGFVRDLLPKLEQGLSGTPLEARVVLAQAALETGWGKHVIRDASGRSSFNLFGIKAGASPDEAVALAETTEFVNGRAERRQEPFRAYASTDASIADYRRLLVTGERYADALGAKDPSAFADALQEAGYATDPDYATKLKRVYQSVLRVLAEDRSAAEVD